MICQERVLGETGLLESRTSEPWSECWGLRVRKVRDAHNPARFVGRASMGSRQLHRTPLPRRVSPSALET